MFQPILFAQQQEVDLEGAAGFGIGIFVVYLAVIILTVAGLWKVFVKAGKPGWAAIVPIYNVIVLLEIAGKPVWWVILMFIPFVNFVVSILIAIDVAKNFGKEALYGIGLAFLPFIFYPLLGFGDARYRPQTGSY
ncbi:MAG: DUF5684 domain-containing protein [Zavarzinella sp.]